MLISAIFTWFAFLHITVRYVQGTGSVADASQCLTRLPGPTTSIGEALQCEEVYFFLPPHMGSRCEHLPGSVAVSIGDIHMEMDKTNWKGYSLVIYCRHIFWRTIAYIKTTNSNWELGLLIMYWRLLRQLQIGISLFGQCGNDSQSYDTWAAAGAAAGAAAASRRHFCSRPCWGHGGALVNGLNLCAFFFF